MKLGTFEFWAGFIVGFAVMGMIKTATEIKQSEVITAGCAYYAPDTGKFTWKDKE